MLDDVQGTQKELNSLQMLIGQHDERLSTIQQDRAQEQEDADNCLLVGALWVLCSLRFRSFSLWNELSQS